MDVRSLVVSFPTLKSVATILKGGTLRALEISFIQFDNGGIWDTPEACRTQSFSRPGMPVEALSVFESRSSVKARRSCSVIDPSL